MNSTSNAANQLDTFIDKYSPEIAGQARSVLEKMRAILPGAVEMVYDNYNGLVVGFGPSEKPSEALFSIVLYPRWLNIFFLTGAELSDPDKLLQGDGKQVRHMRLTSPDVIDDPSILGLIRQALDRAGDPIDFQLPRRLVIKSISQKQRPRRPE